MLPNYRVQRKTGDERIRINLSKSGPTVAEFWQWSASDLLSNSLRGIFAEYLVAHALGLANDVRTEWDATDLRLKNGVRIEVKSAAYLQSWSQKELSKISFSIRKTNGWDAETNELSTDRRRQSDLYVFCLLSHMDKYTVDPLDMDQWKFFVILTSDLNRDLDDQQSIGLNRLRALPHQECGYDGLADVVTGMAAKIANNKAPTGRF